MEKMKECKHLAIIMDGNGRWAKSKGLPRSAGHMAGSDNVRNIAMGKGFSEFGMKQIIQIGFNNYQLKQIYWCVSPDNHRAVKFYDKNGYKRIDFNKLHIKCTYSEDQIKKFIWYAVTKDTKFINR